VNGGSRRAFLWRGLAVWLLFMGVETVLGTLRTLYVEPVLGPLRARQTAFPLGLAVIALVVYLTIRWISPRDTKQALALGLVWAGLTFAFELAIGVFAMGLPVAAALADYDPRRGGLMALGLLALVLMPEAMRRLRQS
jgi:uncharacterized membrane protein (DUF485 family)